MIWFSDAGLEAAGTTRAVGEGVSSCLRAECWAIHKSRFAYVRDTDMFRDHTGAGLL
jgi:hypothetical protein